MRAALAVLIRGRYFAPGREGRLSLKESHFCHFFAIFLPFSGRVFGSWNVNMGAVVHCRWLSHLREDEGGSSGHLGDC